MNVEEKKEIKVNVKKIIDQSKDNLCRWSKESNVHNGKDIQRQNTRKISGK